MLDIGIPPVLPEEQSVDVEKLAPEWVGIPTSRRAPSTSHKGTYGHALVVAGSRHYVGARGGWPRRLPSAPAPG